MSSCLVVVVRGMRVGPWLGICAPELLQLNQVSDSLSQRNSRLHATTTKSRRDGEARPNVSAWVEMEMCR